MAKKFKTMEEFEKFCDTAMLCVCGRLMTGLHMSGCTKLRKARLELQERLKKDITHKE